MSITIRCCISSIYVRTSEKHFGDRFRIFRNVITFTSSTYRRAIDYHQLYTNRIRDLGGFRTLYDISYGVAIAYLLYWSVLAEGAYINIILPNMFSNTEQQSNTAAHLTRYFVGLNRDDARACLPDLF